MNKILATVLLAMVANGTVLSQQREQPRRPRPLLENAVLGFYVNQFQQQTGVSDEVFAKILPFLRQFIHERFEISARRLQAMNQLRMMIDRGDSDETIKRAIREVDKADADIQTNQEKFLDNVDPLLTIQQQAKVRIFQVMSDQQVRQMLDRLQNQPQNRQDQPLGRAR